MHPKKNNFLWLQIPVLAIALLLLAFPGKIYGGQLPEGRYTERYENNRIKVKGHYHNGQKTGNWFYFGTNGILQKRERWNKGQLKLTFLYNEKGRLASITNNKGVTTYKPGCGCQ
jgi:antitoxin component YwqK of YwqJK toxin-antitoxin module